MPHSILKKTNSSGIPTPAPPAAHSREDRDRETALHHAQLLQQRKDVEALVLASIEALLDVPSSVDADPAHPSPSDAALVKNLLRPFQPSDYDDLIEERNINEQCGYVLCPQNKKKQDTKARYRILHGTGKTPDALKFVPTQSLEMWCSDDCGKRAMYIKVQLNEELAWIRANSPSGDIELLEDRHSSNGAMSLVEGMTSLNVAPAEDHSVKRVKALAVERGDSSASSRPNRLGEVCIREKIIANSRTPCPEAPGGPSPSPRGSIEGYTPRFMGKIVKGEETDEKEEDDLLPTL